MFLNNSFNFLVIQTAIQFEESDAICNCARQTVIGDIVPKAVIC